MAHDNGDIVCRTAVLTDGVCQGGVATVLLTRQSFNPGGSGRNSGGLRHQTHAPYCKCSISKQLNP